MDVLFHATAAAGGVTAKGVLLTRMRADGAAGFLALRRAGALTVAQGKATSVVAGMPAEAIRQGAARDAAGAEREWGGTSDE